MDAAQPDQNIAAFAERHGYTRERGQAEAERLIAGAVQERLAGGTSACFDRLPFELEPLARARAQAAIERREAPALSGFVASSGGSIN